ncbi:uncharacterized protein LOC116732507 [Xiphophorus hellerii]|uniref:uncharacterized protein LOC116732507 n=1 Tax=Xiphophorus hellerii TaxID=8084 RepID=UPI0013B3FBB4|nr:uncharacterized protein LOC116732507 [Xiphophorus hellerii]
MKCGGNDTKWRMMMFTDSTSQTYVQCYNWEMMDGSSCTIHTLVIHSGVYWCESGSGEFSNAVNITVQDDYDDVILVSPVHPVTEGDPVTLNCRDKEQNLLSNVFFYHNDKLINNDSREELNISAVSKSDEGFYKCQHSGKESPRSWMSVRVTVSSPVSSSFPVMLIVRPVVGFILGFLLLLMLCCKQSKGLWCFRSEVSSQSSTTNQGPNQTESQVYSSLLHGDASEYESIQPATMNRSSDDPEDDSVHSCIKTETTETTES